jgi:sugar lactone lactonase YvrE
MRVVLGVPDSIGTRIDSIGTRVKLTEPAALVFSPADGVLYVADRGAVRQVNGVSTRVARVFSVASNGRATLLLDAGGCSSGVCIVRPVAMTQHNGALLIADAAGNRVFRYVPGAQPTVIAGTGAAASAPDGAAAAQSPIHRPSGVAVAADGRIFVSEQGADRVRVIGGDGLLGTVAGSGASGFGGDGGPAVAAAINDPAGLHLHEGVLYIAEYGSGAVRVVDASGVIRTVAGMGGVTGFGGDGGPATSARLSRPWDVTVTADGRSLFISDQDNGRVRVVDLASGSIRTFAGTGGTAFTGDRRAAGETALLQPGALDAAENGFLFIADRGHYVIWRTATRYE